MSNGAHDIFVAKFDSSGNLLWDKSFGDAADQKQASLALDASGNIFLGGSFPGQIDFGGGALVSMGDDDLFLAKLDPSGSHLWSKRFGDTNDQSFGTVAVDPSGRPILVSGCSGAVDFGGGPLQSAGGTTGGQDVFVAKFDASGNYLWNRRFGDAQQQLPPPSRSTPPARPSSRACSTVSSTSASDP